LGDRKIKLKPSKEVVWLTPQLNMREALDNDMDKNSGSFNPVDPGNKFDKQLRVTMECATKKDENRLEKEVKKLYACSGELKQRDIEMSTPLIASQAYYMTGNHEQSLFHVDKSIALSQEAMSTDRDDQVAFAVWIASMYRKGAILSGLKKRKEAILIYEAVAEEATVRHEVFHVMESYRMSGYLYYELLDNEEALQRFLLSIYAGSYLAIDIRRQSTFLYAACLALLLCRKIREVEDVETLERQLNEWLGADWRELVEGKRMKAASKRKKASIFD
jgi:tetratricopeptide (TPR) repeat protein